MFTLADSHVSTPTFDTQGVFAPSPTVLEIAAALGTINDAPLLERLSSYRPAAGNPGYGYRSLWRACFAGYILGVASMSDLVRRLEDSIELRLLCGLDKPPSLSTFSRFYARLSEHTDLVLGCIHELTAEFAKRLPNFGEKIAVDSSIIDAYAARYRKPSADADASWTAKSGANGEIEYRFGYKFHLAVDAIHGVPIAALTSTAGVYDGHYLPPLLEQAASVHSWFKPTYVLADKGYDAQDVYRDIDRHGATAIIPIRNLRAGASREGPYTNDDELTCMGGRVMERVKTDPHKGTLYRCPDGGCHLLKRKGVLYCQDTEWDKPTDLRRFPKLPRDTPEWKAIYKERQSVERSFKSMKEARRLAKPNLQGLQKVTLHCLMSSLATAATMMARLRAGDVAGMRWQVRKVA